MNFLLEGSITKGLSTPSHRNSQKFVFNLTDFPLGEGTPHDYGLNDGLNFPMTEKIIPVLNIISSNNKNNTISLDMWFVGL